MSWIQKLLPTSHFPSPWRKMEKMKEVTIDCGTKTKVLDLDFGSYDKTVEIIRKKFNMPGEFNLKAISSKGKEIDIDDDEDLVRFQGCQTFIVRPIDSTEDSAIGLHHQSGHPEVTSTQPPPSYEQSIFTGQQPPAQNAPIEKKVIIEFNGKRKSVCIYPENVEMTRDSIRQRLGLPEEFKLLAKQPGTGENIDIEDEGDVDDLKAAESLAVDEDVTDSAGVTRHDLEVVHLDVEGEQQDRQKNAPIEKKAIIEFKGKRKSVCIYPENVEMTRDSIRQRLGLPEEFKLLAKQPGTGENIDIEDEGDVDDLKAAESLAVDDEVTDSAGVTRHDRGGEGEQQDRQKGMVCKVQPETAGQALQGETCPSVMIDGVMYPFNKPPPPTSLVVKREMRNLAANFDIQAIIRQIDIVAVCLRIVLYGVVSKRDLELQVVEMQAKIESLCNVSSKAVKQFGMKATNIQSEMKYGIGCLMEEFGDLATDHFQNIAKIGGEMKGAAEGLKTALEDLQVAVNNVYIAVTKATTAHLDATEETQEAITTEVRDGKKEFLEKKQTQARLDREAADERAKKKSEGGFDTSRVKAVLDQDKSTEEAVCLCGKDVCCVVCCDGSLLKCNHKKRRTFFYRYAKQKSDHRIQAEYALMEREKAIRLEAIQERERARQIEEEATKELLDFTESLKKVDPSENPEDVIENALRGSEKALKTLRSAVETIINFWDDLQLQSESVMNAGSGSIGTLADGNLDEQKRKAFFLSEVFQCSAVEYLGKWVAMQMMCEAFTSAMKPIQRNLQCSVSDTPSRQQSLKKIPDLVLQLDQKLAERQDDLRADDARDAEEIQAIMAGAHTM